MASTIKERSASVDVHPPGGGISWIAAAVEGRRDILLQVFLSCFRTESWGWSGGSEASDDESKDRNESR
eukprot:scaffold7006_cov174-Skeletonema_marinoi.AAC.13